MKPLSPDGNRAAKSANRLAFCILLMSLVFLWGRLILHLRVEWSVNPQYSYGWGVPFLCVYLMWDRFRGPAKASWEMGDGRWARTFCHLPSPIFYLLLALCALLYAPTRLIQEANPEWRLVSWALALQVIGITLLVLRLAPGGGAGRGVPRTSDLRPLTSDSGISAFSFSDFVFPVLFFLVAVPWPTVIESRLIQGLTRANAGAAIEILNWLGTPALQHGNFIEISTGLVGIDDACSGIRSFQATLMISLFLGGLYRLAIRRRVALCLLGFALAFLFNVGRTSLLTLIAARNGTAAIMAWHDPAGVTILVACFLSLWLLAVWFRRRASRPFNVSAFQRVSVSVNPSSRPAHLPSPISHLRGISLALAAWLVVVEAGTELWYRSHEWGVARTVVWQVEFPQDAASFREVPFSEATRQFLRYDEGRNAAWQERDGTKWQMIFLRWNPGRIAVHLAKSHTPEVCLTAAGQDVVSQSGLHPVPVHGLELPFFSYVVKGKEGLFHVFYCLWEDRAATQSFQTTGLSYANRLRPVWAGRRNSGQRSLEVAIWGIDGDQEAEAELRRQLERLIRIEGKS